MNIKRGLKYALPPIILSPVAFGLAVVLLVAAVDSNRPNGVLSAGALRIGAGYVPAEYASAIEAAAAACDQGLSPAVLAAQLEQESAFNPQANSGKAQGIAQFTAGTWNSWGDGKPADVWDPTAAITAQGRFMCALLKKAKAHPEYNGAPTELALAAYNAGWGAVEQFKGVPPPSFAGGETHDYVQRIMANVARFSAPPDTTVVALPANFSLPDNTPAPVRTAIAWALKQRGGSYSYGGSCTDPLGANPATQCDCSSLMQQSYAAAGVSIPRVTGDQVNVGTRVNMDDVKPGDLVFNAGTDGNADIPGHVAMYIGNGLIIEAPHTGAQIRVVSYDTWRNSTSPETRITAVVRVVNW